MFKNILKNKYLMLILSFVLACGLTYVLPGSADMALYDNVIRIHVVANSDSETDQALKYKVRDEVIAVSSILLQDCANISRAEEIIRANLGVLEDAAYQTHAAEGVSYGVRASLSKEFYPTRNYGSFRLPAGKYLSLKISLGAAEGQNWWCVIYPSLCLSAAADTDRIRLIDSEAPVNYKIKFKILDWWHSHPLAWGQSAHWE